jgi:cystathionine beta-lyase
MSTPVLEGRRIMTDREKDATGRGDDHPAAEPSHRFATRLSHLGRPGIRVHGFVNPPLHRGSTVLAPSLAARREASRHRYDQYLVYGLYGNATHHALEDLLADVEGGSRCQIVSSGLAANCIGLLAFLRHGEHCLIPDSVYGPVRSFCKRVLAERNGIEVGHYRPDLGAAELEALLQPNTRVLYLESPGSHTFEVQDVSALAGVARRRGIKVLMDNTWGLHFFQPFRHGVDVSIQALTKYAAGHADVLLGSLVTNDEENWHAVRDAALLHGQYASPDDCWLTLRGLRTLAVRLQHQMAAGLEVACWFAGRPEVLRVLHPALPGSPGHELWKRDFSGACSLFGVVFRPAYRPEALDRMIERLRLFGIGASWGGFESLALPTYGNVVRSVASPDPGGPAVRFYIGLEDPADLMADLAQGFEALGAPPAAPA